MVDPSAFLKAGLQLHGDACPAVVIGLRAGAAAMNWLGVGRATGDQLLAVLHLPEDRCIADGVQTITGCTLGKGNLQIVGRGPFSLTLVERATRRAVRVVAATRLPTPATASPDASVLALVGRLLNAPEREILVVGEEFRYEAPLARAGSRTGSRNAARLTTVKARGHARS